MIEYKCSRCGNTLETDDSLSGQQEQCPICRKLNPVPLSKEDLAKRHAEEAAERERTRQEQARLIAIEREAQKQEHEEEETQRTLLAAKEYEAHKKRSQEEEAKRAVLESLRLQQEQERMQRSLKKSTTSDLFLWMSFKIAKMISVVVVGLCLLVAVGAGVYLLFVTPDAPKTVLLQPRTSFDSPRLEDLIRELAERAKKGNPAPEVDPVGDRLRPQTSPTEMQWGGRLKKLMQDYSLSEDGYSTLLGWLENMPSNYQEQFVVGVEKLLASVKKHITSGNNPKITVANAINWFKYDFFSSIAEVKASELRARQAEEAAQAERVAAGLRAEATRKLLVFVIVSAVAAMLGFLILPLLIEIEHNTRLLRAK